MLYPSPCQSCLCISSKWMCEHCIWASFAKFFPERCSSEMYLIVCKCTCYSLAVWYSSDSAEWYQICLKKSYLRNKHRGSHQMAYVNKMLCSITLVVKCATKCCINLIYVDWWTIRGQHPVALDLFLSWKLCAFHRYWDGPTHQSCIYYIIKKVLMSTKATASSLC